MKKVLLLGDSIRYGTGTPAERANGYGIYVNRQLDGEMEVYQPEDNCRFVQYTLRYLHEWAEQLGVGEDIDVVHWNNGLWDVLRLFGDEPLTPIAEYRRLLVRVHARLRLLFPGARIIFALTTPVIEEMSTPAFTRKNSDIEEYNRAAAEVLAPLGVIIHDLHSYAGEIQRQYCRDWVHFNPEGSALLAGRVVAAIRGALAEREGQ